MVWSLKRYNQFINEKSETKLSKSEIENYFQVLTDELEFEPHILTYPHSLSLTYYSIDNISNESIELIKSIVDTISMDRDVYNCYYQIYKPVLTSISKTLHIIVTFVKGTTNFSQFQNTKLIEYKPINKI